MCTYYYLHHHHLPPSCQRLPDIVVHWEFCPHASRDGTTGQPVGQPCSQTFFDPVQSVDAADPCASGGCLVSPICSSGGCRLADLGGRWICCQCDRGGNQLRWCGHKMKKSPDTFCYHRVCENCTSDC